MTDLRPLLMIIVFGSLTVLGAVASCTLQQAKSAADDALTVAQIACIFASSLTDNDAVLTACRIDAKLTPLVSQLIGQREGAKKAGVRWTPADAGGT